MKNTSIETATAQPAASHTPGPWTIAGLSIFGADGKYVAGLGGVACRTGFEQQANAKFIAAAPETAKQRDELLALLKRWYSWCNDGVQPISVRTQIESETRAAIASATGGVS